MLPSLTERDIEEGLRSFIEREFPIATPAFVPGGKTVVEHYLDEKTNLIKGPWLEIRRPFRKTPTDMEKALPFLSGRWGIAKNWVPYEHQRKAFERLRYPTPKSTIVATGTGSGKTECFLLPMLDAVLQMKAAKIPGIKAIVIYPMNALASDQSKRFSSWCESIAAAGGPNLTVGLYVGSPGVRSKVMKGETCITDRETLQKNPPDILLTNYKMLDFLLLRREDRALWAGTTAQSLRYLVVDELHTFDGAQGTDLACLVRRLRDFLDLKEELTCIGTSATLGGDDGLAALKRYAADVFGADFTSDESVITEDRLTLQEYLDSFGPKHYVGRWPSLLQFRSLKDLNHAAAPERFLSEAYRCWFGNFLPLSAAGQSSWAQAAFKLGEELPHLEAFQRLMSEEDSLIHIDELAERWRRGIEALKAYTHADMVLLIRSLVALVSMARLPGPTGKPVPFLTVRVQMWIRELTQMLATVSIPPKLIAGADLDETKVKALPIVTCRSCNATAWGAFVSQSKLSMSAQNFYQAWFAGKPEACLLYPLTDREFKERRDKLSRELRFLNVKDESLEWISPDQSVKGVLSQTAPDEKGTVHRIIVRCPDLTEEVKNEAGRYVRLSRKCPWCGAENAMRIFGARSATLSSALFGHLNSSAANDDHKLILFSDSVQDAAHRAGFIEARNYLYSVRQAIAGFIRDPSTKDMPFDYFLSGITTFWKDQIGGTDELRRSLYPGVSKRADDIATARFVATFAPLDMYWRRAWRDFEEKAAALWRSPSDGGFVEKVSTDEDRYRFVPTLTEATQEGVTRTEWGRFADNVMGRLRWSAFMELTARIRSGRTVELAGIGSISPMSDLVIAAASMLRESLAESIGRLRDVSVEQFVIFITGFLMQQKTRGDFDLRGIQGLEDFARYVETGDDYIFNRSLTLPTFGGNFRPPAPLVLMPLRSQKQRFFDCVLPKNASAETWYTVWATKNFGAELDIAAAYDEIYAKLLQALEKAELVKTVWMTGKENACVYLLNPQTWLVKRHLKKAVCPICGRWHVIEDSEDAIHAWKNMPCLSKDCIGDHHDIYDYAEEETLYRGVPVHASAREHTANVEGTERGKIERSFIHGKEPWDVNMLSATPTLEMGIDIGDLSSVLLGSMPPKQANYLQRIGRAGRRDGNALAMTVCGPNAHAQYFWADPEKMLAGAVEPPGVFLHAMAVLERQLFALALARWLSDNPNAVIPPKIKEVLDAVSTDAGEAYSAESFPKGFLDYVSDRADMLVADFHRLFLPNGDPNAGRYFTTEELARLRDYLLGRAAAGQSSLRDRLLGKLRALSHQKESYNRRKQDYANALKRKQREPASEARDNDIEELKANISALSALIAEEFADKNTLNLLTDEGLLPNYAFPEEGITIDGIVIKVRGRDSLVAADNAQYAGKAGAKKNRGEYKRLTFQRPASSGLFEVAPENKFFVNEYVLHIDQVDLADDGVKKWRFCPACQFSALESLVEDSSCCPRCGSVGWADASQRKDVLQLRTVYAYADLRRDRIDDSNESRRTETQSKKLLIEIEPDAERRAFVLDDAGGFGFEYVSKATLRDFNFDRVAAADGSSIEVAGDKLPASGFTVCACCGRVKQRERKQNENEKKVREQHDLNCKYRNTPEKAEWIDGLMLYREFQSEALRLRVPVGLAFSGYHPSVATESLSAALRLGLKRYFHGSVDHLRIVSVTEPEGQMRQSYIVVYDTVPGGTGYLKELMADPQNLLGVFRTALDVMMDCDCADDPEADGCYKCVYQHRDAAVRSKISKRCAIEVLTNLLGSASTLKAGRIDTNAERDFDSELEAAFIRAVGASPLAAEMKHCQESGGLGYWVLKMHSGRVWRVDPQVDFSGDCPSRPDFLFRPWKEADRKPELEMAVFTDGWQFHAGIVKEDCAKRQSILNAGHRVWTIMWDDLPQEDKHRKQAQAETLLERPLTGGVYKLIKGGYEKRSTLLSQRSGATFPSIETLLEDWTGEKTNLDRLLLWLSDPEAAVCAANALLFVQSMSTVFDKSGKQRRPFVLPEELSDALEPDLPVQMRHFSSAEGNSEGWTAVRNTNSSWRTAFFIDADYFATRRLEGAHSRDAESLRKFWANVNMAVLGNGALLLPEPFRPGAADFASLEHQPWARALLKLAEQPVRWPMMQPTLVGEEASSAGSDDLGWTDSRDLLPEDLLPLADALEAAGIAVDPENVGVEHADRTSGKIDCVFELYWPAAKLAVSLDCEEAEIDGITVLNGANPVEELAQQIADAIKQSQTK
ncbi:DEAD/DEAH box helicase [Sutterella massiliensis]|uniref:DEAD/DEAH box helicase n=1 Tax=Sutterella massiliensis TaxID=1816689 RepID=A0ABS2DUA7_9BURK|nr:DEAD/DEAH box helicase [Sutterella massiliensis]MBM6704940.1 DEAD/DEAH box helicase [Sutterella massiliensis]